MKPNSVVHATTIDLDHQPVPAEQSVGGGPTTATMALGDFGGFDVGVWEMTPGVMNDVETDEVFANGTPTMRLARIFRGMLV